MVENIIISVIIYSVVFCEVVLVLEFFFFGIAFLVISGFVFTLIYTSKIAKKVYFKQLVRTDKEKWGRVCSAPENEEQMLMWNAGINWANENAEQKTDVHIVNDGLSLYGEFYDFGSDKCVIVLPGRCECLKYSYYFAPPYQKAGFNVLVIDTRAHGNSDGTYNTIGVKESKDVIAWMNFIADKFSQKEIYVHSICVGSSAGLLALTDTDCPKCAVGIITEGCFVTFRETFKRHMIYDNRPLFPVLDLTMLNIKKYTGTNVYRSTPLKAVKKLDKRILFLFGKKDVFSIPKKSQQLFDACESSDKKIVWFDKGGHSHLRINNTEKYDNAIIEFLNNEK